VTEVAAELPLQAIAEIMGVPRRSKAHFRLSNRMIGIDDPEFANDDGATAFIELYTYVNELGKQRRSDPREDIVTKLNHSEIAGKQPANSNSTCYAALSVAGTRHPQRQAWG